MGGRGSGGNRVGAGRKSKSAALALVHGSRDRGTRPTETAAAVATSAVVAPVGMTEAQASVWAELAPLAIANGTLTLDRALAFRDLCEAVVERRAMAAQIEADGRTFVKISVDGAGVEHRELKAHPLIGRHQTHMVRVSNELARFRLTGDGKLQAKAEPKPKSALELLRDQAAAMKRG